MFFHSVEAGGSAGGDVSILEFYSHNVDWFDFLAELMTLLRRLCLEFGNETFLAQVGMIVVPLANSRGSR